MKLRHGRLSGMVATLVFLSMSFFLVSEGFSADNLVTNGSFEIPVLPANVESGTLPDGWGIFAGTRIFLASYPSYDGNQFEELNAASLTQTVSQVAQAGYVYTLSAAYGGYYSGSLHRFVLDAVNPADPSQTLTLIDNTKLSITSIWTNFSQTCVAVPAAQNNWSLRVKIESLSGWCTFDDFVLTATPPGGTVIMIR